MPSPLTVLIARNHLALMQQLLDLVSRGYRLHTQGVVPILRAQSLAKKFAQMYGTAQTPPERTRNRAHGLASARFVVYPADADHLEWWLLATAGRGTIHDRERLHDASDRYHPVTLADKYRLVREIRPRCEGGGVHWTWRLTASHRDAWRYSVVQAARRSVGYELERQVGALVHMPLWHGVRREVKGLLNTARRVWTHNARRPAGSELTWPEQLPWSQRIRVYDETPMTLATLVARYRVRISAHEGGHVAAPTPAGLTAPDRRE